jgi:uncharacterized protein DUF3592
MEHFIGVGLIVIVALSPLLRRFYMDRFWVHARGTVIRLDGGINFNPGPGGGSWVWTPVIEYQAGGQRFSSRISYWQRFNAKSKYSVGDEVNILYDPQNPSRVMLDSWVSHIFLTIFISGLIGAELSHAR